MFGDMLYVGDLVATGLWRSGFLPWFSGFRLMIHQIVAQQTQESFVAWIPSMSQAVFDDLHFAAEGREMTADPVIATSLKLGTILRMLQGRGWRASERHWTIEKSSSSWRLKHDAAQKAIWVCLKIGYIPNYSHLIGIMISKTIGCRGTNHFQTNPYLAEWRRDVLQQIPLIVATATLIAATAHQLQVARICHKRLIHDDRCSWNPMVGWNITNCPKVWWNPHNSIQFIICPYVSLFFCWSKESFFVGRWTPQCPHSCLSNPPRHFMSFLRVEIFQSVNLLLFKVVWFRISNIKIFKQLFLGKLQLPHVITTLLRCH